MDSRNQSISQRFIKNYSLPCHSASSAAPIHFMLGMLQLFLHKKQFFALRSLKTSAPFQKCLEVSACLMYTDLPHLQTYLYASSLYQWKFGRQRLDSWAKGVSLREPLKPKTRYTGQYSKTPVYTVQKDYMQMAYGHTICFTSWIIEKYSWKQFYIMYFYVS